MLSRRSRAIAAGLIFVILTSLGYTLLIDPRVGDSIAGLWRRGPAPGGIDPRATISPDRRYHLVVWDYRLPLTSPSGAPFEEATRAAIRRFQDRYPNVTVDLHLLDPADGPAQMAQALAAGYPPDVYASPYGLPALGSPLQVPVGLYLDYDTWARYHPVAWQTVKTGETVWAWPRWIMFWPWLCNQDLLHRAGLDPARLASEGWTRDEFSALVEAVSEAPHRWERAATLAAPSPAIVLRDLLLSGFLAGEEAPSPEAYWTGPEVKTVTTWLSGIREAGGLRVESSGRNPGTLDSFVHGRSAVLAGPSPWATTFLLEVVRREDPWQYTVPSRAGRPGMVLAPPPRGQDQPAATWVSAAPVMVFRQARYRGDDNTRLAMELAREISLGARPWLRDEVLCAPASLSEMASWELRLPEYGPAGLFTLTALERLAALPPGRLSLALTAINYGPWAPTPGLSGRFEEYPGLQSRADFTERAYLGPFLQHQVEAAVTSFWMGDIPAEELGAEIGGGFPQGP